MLQAPFFRQAKLNVAGRSSGLAALRALSRCSAALDYRLSSALRAISRGKDDDCDS